MTKKDFKFTDELELAFYSLKDKIVKEVDKGVFTKQEHLIMVDAYYAITGKLPAENCSSCFAMTKRILVNFFNLFPKSEIVKVAKKPKSKKVIK